MLESSNFIRRRPACVARFTCGMLAALFFAGTTPEALANDAHPFVHSGLLHTQKDFDRMRIEVAHGDQPWVAGWQKLVANRHASLNWKPNPQAIGKSPLTRIIRLAN
jgi:hypothetical protein